MKFVDVQLYPAPISVRRFPSAADDGTFVTFSQFPTTPAQCFFSAIVEAVNETGEIVQAGSPELELKVVGGKTSLRYEARRETMGKQGALLYYVPAVATPAAGAVADPLEDAPAAPTKPLHWRAEEKDSFEYPWRPGERMRFALYGTCGDEVAREVAARSATLAVSVPTTPLFQSVRSGGNFGGHAEVTLPGRVTTAALLKLPSGETTVALGSAVLDTKKGTPVWTDMPTLGLSLHTAEESDLPVEVPRIEGTSRELTAKLVSAKLVHFADDKDEKISKGMRRLDTTWSFHVDSAALAARAEKTLKTERDALFRAVPCVDIALVTDRRTAKPLETTGCKALETSDDGEVKLSFLIGRYEVPTAIAWKLEGKAVVKLLASQSLLALDPR